MLERNTRNNAYELYAPNREKTFLASWDGSRPLTLSLVSGMVNEAYRAGYNAANTKLNKIERIINGT